MYNKNLPAYPASASWNDNNPEIIQVEQAGLTKRELIAAMAMQGLLAGAETTMTAKDLAIQSLKCADELLKQLE